MTVDEAPNLNRHQTRRLLAVDTAAGEADVSRNTIYRAINAGHLDLVHIGRSSRITAESFDRWIAGLPRRIAA